MPADFLLPLFAITLLGNAILVAAAIRGLRRGSADPESPIDRGRPIVTPPRGARERERPITAEVARAIASRRGIVGEPGATESPAARAVASVADGPVADGPLADTASRPAPRADASGPIEAPLTPDTRAGPVPSPVGATARRGPRTGAASPGRRPNPPTDPTAGRRTRRKFALPPLDDDHERVSRSIETFLGGNEPTGSEAAADAAPDSGAPLASAATTVALVAIDGLPRARRGRAAQAGDNDEASAALAMVERTIRAAARGTDVVSVTARGRYRIVLPGTGEVAARAYLRRIRAAVEPILQSVEPPLRLALAAATVLDEPIGDAVRRAGARLAATRAALDGPAGDAGEGERPSPITSPGESPDEPRGDTQPRVAPD